MKRILGSSILAGLIIMAACSKDDKQAPAGGGLATQPEAVAANDTKSGGVYKGVILGSSGTIKIVLQNNTITATVTIDGVTKTLTAANLPAGWTSGTALNAVRFTGENGTWSLEFTVGANGESPVIGNITIPGHPGASIQIAKETSTFQIRAYEGRYGNGQSDSDRGTWNFVTAHGDSLFGVHEWTSGMNKPMMGHNNFPSKDSIQLYYWPNEMRAVGKMVGDSVATGTWRSDYQQAGSGRWKVRRTL